jgi:hypothetical protein
MDKAFIILAHKNIRQLNRLVAKLHDGTSYFFIHIDLKVPQDELALLNWLPDRMHLVKRLDARWADFSLVEATLNAMEAIKGTNKHFHTITLLSGQDYPIKSNDFINNFFENSESGIFIESYRLPNYEKWSPRGGLYRVDKYFFGLKEYQLFCSRVVNFLGNIFPALKRKQLQDTTPYAGSQWWTMDMYTLDYVLGYVRSNPSYTAFHKATFAPDEIFFHTILLNANDMRIRAGIVNNNKRFIRWKSGTNSHPELLQEEDLQDITHSDCLFARKLDLNLYPEIFDLIDQQCLNNKIAAA